MNGIMNRRSFLIGAIASFAAINVADATVMLDTDTVPENVLSYVDKINNVIRMHDDIVVSYKNGKDRYDPAPDLNDLFGYLLDNFERPTSENFDENKIIAKQIYRTNGVNKWDVFREVPPVIPSAIIPVAVLASLLSNHDVELNIPKIPNYKKIVQHYGALVIEF